MSVGPDDAVVDPAAVTDPTADEAARNAEAEANKGKLIASLQEKAARVNEAERRAAAAEAEAERLRKAQTPAAPSPNLDPRQQRLRETFAWAQGQKDAEGRPDPVAGAVIDLATENELMRQQLAEKAELDEIEDPAIRKQVRAHLNENRKLGREIDVQSAVDAIKAQEAESLRAENERLQAALKAAQAPSGVTPPTHHATVPASTLKARTLTEDEYEEELKGLPVLERMKKHEEVEQGLIRIRR